MEPQTSVQNHIYWRLITKVVFEIQQVPHVRSPFDLSYILSEENRHTLTTFSHIVYCCNRPKMQRMNKPFRKITINHRKYHCSLHDFFKVQVPSATSIMKPRYTEKQLLHFMFTPDTVTTRLPPHNCLHVL